MRELGSREAKATYSTQGHLTGPAHSAMWDIWSFIHVASGRQQGWLATKWNIFFAEKFKIMNQLQVSIKVH